MRKLKKEEVEDIVALTPIQEGMLFHYLENSDAAYYFEQLSLTLGGNVQKKLFQDAWKTVVAQNELLRTFFRWQHIKSPVQIVLKEINPVLSFIDLCNIDVQNEKMEEIKEQDRIDKFDLEQVPFRVKLCKLSDEKSVMIITNHHIIYDGWSNGIILKEFINEYNALSESGKSVLNQKQKYSSYVRYIQEYDKDSATQFWSRYLQGFDTLTDLPVKKKEYCASKQSKDVLIRFPKEDITQFASVHEITLASILYSAWGILLQKYNNHDDVIFGTTVSGRNVDLPYIEEVVGVFINTIPLRIHADSSQSILDVMKMVNQDLVRREEYEITSLLDIKKCLDLNSNSDLFQSIMVMEDYPLDSILKSNNSALCINDYELIETTNFDLTISVKNYEQLLINFNYNSDLFDENTIKRMANHFAKILNILLKAPTDTALKDISIVTENEKEQIFFEFNKEKIELPENKTLIDFIRNGNPDKVAIRMGNEEVTYGEIEERSNQMAQYLQSAGIHKGDVVAFLLERSIEMIINILAVWKVNAVYLPLNRKDPIERIAGIVEAAKVSLLITKSDYRVNLTGKVKEVLILAIDEIASSLTQLSSEKTEIEIDQNSVAYIIYTSGSTGKPKGAMVEHIGMLNHILSKKELLTIQEASVVAQNASHMFDISIWQMFSALAFGGETVVFDDNVLLDIKCFLDYVVNYRVTILEVVPSYLGLMMEQLEQQEITFLDLEYLIVTGEEVKPKLVNKWIDKYYNIPMVNAYGPTEASDDITHFVIKDVIESDSVPIGRPIPNMNIYIMDKDMNLCPIGIKGEIYVAGVGVGRGYLHEEEKSKKVFLKDPFTLENRMYRTGDLGSWDEEGNINFFGRIDNQVKVRGFRIELEEVESTILSVNHVKEVLVIPYEQTNHIMCLCAYFIASEDIEVEELKTYSESHLPQYMVPAYFIHLEKFPLNENGKIDRKKLPKVEEQTKATYIDKEKLQSIANLKKQRKKGNMLEKKATVEKHKEKYKCFVIGESTLAVRCSECMIEYGYEILGVSTTDDAVTSWAEEKGIQHVAVNCDAIYTFLKNKQVDYIFSIYSVLIISDKILELPRKAIINYHDSCLPKYAGMYVPSWAIMNEESVYGCTWHEMEVGIDTGEIIEQEQFPISSNDTAYTLHIKCYENGLNSFRTLLDKIEHDTVTKRKQNIKERSYFGKYKRPQNAAFLSLSWSAQKIDAFIRGLDLNTNVLANPLGIPKIELNGSVFVVDSVRILKESSGAEPGIILKIRPGEVIISTYTEDVAFSSFKNCYGEQVPIEEIIKFCKLKMGDKINDISEEELKRIDEQNLKICRQEESFVKKVQSANRMGFLSKWLPDTEQKEYSIHRFSLKVKNRIELLFVYIALSAEQTGYCVDYMDFIYAQKYDSRIFSNFVPFIVHADIRNSIELFIKNIQEELMRASADSNYLKDIYIRYPELRQERNQFNFENTVGIIAIDKVEECEEIISSYQKNFIIAISKMSDEVVICYNKHVVTADKVRKFVNELFDFSENCKKIGFQETVKNWNGAGVLANVSKYEEVNGYYVNMDKLNDLLSKNKLVKEAVILPVTRYKQTKLHCYVVLDESTDVNATMNKLKNQIPEALVPNQWIQLEEIPKADGIVDKEVLLMLCEEPEKVFECIEPKTDTEKQIVDLWKEILLIEKVNTNVNFFDIGGNSFLTIRLLSKLQNTFSVKLTVTDLFQYSTIESLSTYIEELLKHGSDTMIQQNDAKANVAVIEAYSPAHQEIAIIGISGLFPKAKNKDEFWTNLINGKESISFFSEEELAEEGIDKEILQNENYIRAKGILDDVEYFDADFFGYTPKEATVMDPQVRLLHECVWSALEDGGYAAKIADNKIGLFASSSNNFYWVKNVLEQYRGQVDDFTINVLNDRDFLSTHISYKLNLTGPAMTLQSACSSSLLSVNAAIESIQKGNCNMALAGGVGITYPNKTGYFYLEGMINSPDGHCKAFDADAKGTVMGNGIALVLLKPLSQAIRDKDNIYAVIKGVGINNDGANKVGYTAPSVTGQSEAIRNALEESGLKAEDISYVETHGTGTVLGDPIEVTALTQAFHTEKKQYCGLGSVKTNIGHLDAAAGIAGLVKLALAIKNRVIPSSLHYKSANPNIDFEDTPFYVNTKCKRWNEDGSPIYAGVSSFGIGGTNVHMILGEAPKESYVETDEPNQLVVLSSKTEESLLNALDQLSQHLSKNQDLRIQDVAYTLQTGRKSFAYRKAFVCNTCKEAVEIIKAEKAGTGRKVKSGYAHEKCDDIVFVFGGLGSQYRNMGLELYEKNTIFHKYINEGFRLLDFHDERKIDYQNLMFPSFYPGTKGDKYNIKNMDIAQPVMFIFEYALGKTMMELGIMPSGLVGYSFGEYTAACLAGVFSFEDGIRIIIERGKILNELPNGAMLSIPVSKEKVCESIGNADLAIDNGMTCVISGTIDDVKKAENTFRNKSILTMYIETSHALHSRQMDSGALKLERFMSEIELHAPSIPFVSNVTGNWITKEEAISPHYWSMHMTNTVQFDSDLKTILAMKDRIMLIEIGPGNGMSQMINRYFTEEDKHSVISTIRAEQRVMSDMYCFMNSLADLWKFGVEIDWKRLQEGKDRNRISLPTYSFDKKYFWLDYQNENKEEKKKSKWFFGKNQNPEEWYYGKSWERYNIVDDSNEDQTKRWMIFSNADRGSEYVINSLKQSNKSITIIEKGEKYKKNSNTHYYLNPSEYESYEQLVEDLKTNDNVPDGILHMWFVQEQVETNLQINYVKRRTDEGFYCMMFMAKALGSHNVVEPVVMKIVTQNAVNVLGSDLLSPEQSVVYGPAKIIPLEYTNITFSTIDINAIQNECFRESRLKQLVTQILYNKEDKVIALRGNYKWKPVIKKIKLKRQGKSEDYLVNNGVYVITGGLGGMGLSIASSISKTVTANLVLLGRSIVPERENWKEYLDEKEKNPRYTSIIKKILKMEDNGSHVEMISVDIADAVKMEECVKRLYDKYKKINGIYHTAGVAEYDGVIQNKQTINVEKVLAPKLYGTLMLNQVFHDFDFMFICSSLATVIYYTKIGQVSYCAANEFIDAFCDYKESQGTDNIYCINWADWKGVGMSVQSAEHWGEKLNMDNSQSILDDGIEPEEGVHAIHTVLANDTQHVMVSPEDLIDKIRSYEETGIQTLEEILKESQSEHTIYERPALTSEYVEPETGEEKILCSIWESLFGIKQIGILDDFFELGGDSLKAITVISHIKKCLKVDVTLAEFMKIRTIKEFSNYMAVLHISEQKEIEKVEESMDYELSPMQQRMYFLHELDPEGLNYNMLLVWKLEGILDRERLQNAYEKVLERHESLRTSFEVRKGKTVQLLHNKVEAVVKNITVESEDELEYVIKIFKQQFLLENAPLLHIGIVQMCDSENYLVLDIHHIISDGISNNIIMNDLMHYYNGEELEPLKIQYKDFVKWHKGIMNSEVYEESEKYWLNRFADDIPVLELPYDFKRPNKLKTAGNSIKFSLSEETTGKISEVLKHQQVTLSSFLLSVFHILLSKISNCQDVSIGIPVAGRMHADAEYVVGMFVNTLVLRNKATGQQTFTEFLKSVNMSSMEAFDHSEYQFNDLVEKLGIERNIERNPIFDVMFIMQNMKTPEINLQGMKCMEYDKVKQEAQFDLSFDVKEYDSTIQCELIFASQLFRLETVEEWKEYFLIILEKVLLNQDIRINQIGIPEEQEEWIKQLNCTEKAIDISATIVDLFEQQVRKTPDSIAVTGECDMTYQQLNWFANQLARRIRREVQQREEVIGIIMEPSTSMIIAMLAILKVGSAYMPIDTKAPENRVRYMEEQAKARILITEQNFVEKAEEFKQHEIFECIIYFEDSKLEENCENLESVISPDNLMYVLYTSGSAGNPKGVMVEHRSAVNYCSWMSGQYQMNQNFKHLLLFQYTFDPSVGVIFSTLISGARLFIVDKYSLLNKKKLKNYITKNQIQILHSVPSFFKEFLRYEEKLPSVKYVVMCGEVLETEFKDELMDCGYEVINQYGPTEATIDCLYEVCNREKTVTLGTPVQNTKVYILDDDLNMVPRKTVGELCIGGIGVARGYINNVQLTKEKFVDNPYANGRLYRTGDLALLQKDGRVKLVGRKDFQVKINGIRLELGEISSTLEKHELIRQCVVVCKKDSRDHKYLCAYYTADQAIASEKLRKYLSLHIVESLIPSYFLYLESFPTTLSGKVDRKALPEPDVTGHSELAVPQNEIQSYLYTIWKQILDRDNFSIYDNFFSIGGTSLLVIKMKSMMEERYPDIDIVDLFTYSSIEKLAEFISESKKQYEDSVKEVSKRTMVVAEDYMLADGRNENLGADDYQLELNGKALEQLTFRLEAQNLNHKQLFLSLFAYTMYEASKDEKLRIEVVINSDGSIVQSLFLDMDMIETQQGLYQSVWDNICKNNSFPFTPAHSKEDNEILPVFIWNNSENSAKQMENYDIILELKGNAINRLSVAFRYNRYRVKEEKAEYLFEFYSGLLNGFLVANEGGKA